MYGENYGVVRMNLSQLLPQHRHSASPQGRSP